MSTPAPSPAAASTLDAEVVIEDDSWGETAGIVADIERAVSALAVACPRGLTVPAAATILLASDDRVAGLNANFRGKPQPTNVLSFPSPPSASQPGASRYLGDIVLARETMLREASEQGISVTHHAQHLAVHGLLHLIGYDHETDTDATEMEALETAILAPLGVADPYAD